MRAAALLAAGLVLPPAAAAVADEVTDQLEQARRYYEQGDVTGAIGELEFTLQALRGALTRSACRAGAGSSWCSSAPTVGPDGEVLLEAENTVTTERDATGHAERN